MNSLFFEYFNKVLKWPLLQSRYLQVIVKGLASYMDSIRNDIIIVRAQFIAEETDLWEDFAHVRGISRLPNDTDEQYRVRMLNAYRWQKLAGKVEGLPHILADFGYAGVEVKPDSIEAKWAEFSCLFPELKGNLMAETEDYIRIINEFKPARSKLSGIRYSVKVDVPVRLGAVAKSKTRYIVTPALEV
ncbi:MAG: hypothetical protein AB7E48_04615 [Deferribacterales bacterium]